MILLEDKFSCVNHCLMVEEEITFYTALLMTLNMFINNLGGEALSCSPYSFIFNKVMYQEIHSRVQHFCSLCC